MQDGDTKVDLGAGKHTLAASCAGIIKKCNNDNALRYIFIFPGQVKKLSTRF